MKDVQKILAWLCAILFAAAGVTSILFYNIEREAFSAEAYQRAFDRQGLYDRLPVILGEALYTTIAQDPGADPFLKALTVADWQSAIAALLPPEDLKTLSDDALNSMFVFLNNGSDVVSVSLLPVKNRLAGPQGAQLVQQIIDAQPDCTAQQLLQMGLGFLSGEIALCKPPQEMMGLLAPMLESQMQVMTGAVPNEVVLVTVQGGALNDPRVQWTRTRAVMRWSPLAPVLLLVVLTALAVRSLTDWLKWWGLSFLVVGMLAIFSAMFGSPLLGWIIRTALEDQTGGLLPSVLISFLGKMVDSVSSQVLSPVMLQGAVLGLVGLGMSVTAFVRRI